MSDQDVVQRRIDELVELQRQHQQALEEITDHFRRRQNPPEELIDRAEDLQHRVDALQYLIRSLLPSSRR